MTITKYHPRTTFVTPLNDLMNGLFNRDIGHFIGHDDLRHHGPAVNILDSDVGYSLQMLVPGLAKEDLKLQVENDILTISAEKKEVTKEGERFTRREFGRPAFSRSFKLPNTVNTSAISAELTNGVLHLTLPRTESAMPKSREITIG